jgi:hypothetical protein
MRDFTRLAVALTAVAAFGPTAVSQPPLPPAPIQSRLIGIGPVTPAARAGLADVIVLGKVVEVEKDTVEAAPYKGAPKDQKTSFKVAVLKIDESLVGGKGLTQFRVGFPADAAAAPPIVGAPDAVPVPIRRPGRTGVGVAPTVALTAGMEGCFFLTPHPDGDFYVLAGGGPLLKADKEYAKELDEVKKVVKAIDDPVAALKVKDLGDRFRAAQVILQRYQQSPGGSAARQPIPEEENKLLVALLTELPWGQAKPVPVGGSEEPSRQALWNLIRPNELGFKPPEALAKQGGGPPVDYNQVMDQETSKFLKENADKIRIRGYVRR